MSRVGIWGTSRDFRMIKRQNILCLLVICRTMKRNKLESNVPYMDCLIVIQNVQGKSKTKYTFVSTDNTVFCETLFQFLVYFSTKAGIFNHLVSFGIFFKVCVWPMAEPTANLDFPSSVLFLSCSLFLVTVGGPLAFQISFTLVTIYLNNL